MKNRFVALISLSILSLMSSAQAIAAEEFPNGTSALSVFNKEAIQASSLGLKVWLVILLGTFFIGFIFFVRCHPIARWALLGFASAMFLGKPIFNALELPMLSGSISIMHIVCWTPILILLLVRHPFLNADKGRAFQIWTGALTAVITISFVFDIPDAITYIKHFS